MSVIVEAVLAEIGAVRRSPWMTVDQQLIDRFAESTFDRQFIHIDPQRAAGTPFGGTVAHGLLTLSLLPHLLESAKEAEAAPVKMVVNYGFDRVRFVHPVRAGDRIRATFTLHESQEKRPGQFQQSHHVSVEIDGAAKPAVTAIWLTQLFL